VAQHIAIFLVVTGALAGVGYAVAACFREWFKGRALLIRARRGDPEQPTLIQLSNPNSGRGRDG